MMRPEHVVIIGSGPAGLTAAVYCARMGLTPLVIDGPLPGGQLMTTFLVENWPGEKSVLGPTLIQKMRSHAEHFGTRFLSETVKSIDPYSNPFSITTTNNSTIQTKSIIIASGATPRRLGCPGESTYWGQGVSSCAICDGAFYENKKVLVIGGGNSALEQALFLSRFTPNIYLLHRGTQLTATEAYLWEGIKKIPNLSILYETELLEIQGDGSKVTEAILIHRTKGQSILAVDGVFIAIGTQAQTNFLPEELHINSRKQIVLSTGSHTSIAGIFAAGDVTQYAYRQAITAAAAGCQAALDVQNYLKKTTITVD